MSLPQSESLSGVLTGDALTHLSEEALLGQLPRVNLFCRINPQQKLRILLALKRLDHVVGFLGDGINDAPALHAADVGISVDGAADVARAAADLILLSMIFRLCAKLWSADARRSRTSPNTS